MSYIGNFTAYKSQSIVYTMAEEKVQKILTLAEYVSDNTPAMINQTRIDVLNTVIAKLVGLAGERRQGYDLLSFLFTEELDKGKLLPPDPADGDGGMFISSALWTVIGTIMDSKSFQYEEGHSIFHKDDGSGRDIYIKSVVLFTHKTEEQTADAVHMLEWGKQYAHQHRIRTVLSLFAIKTKPRGRKKARKALDFEPFRRGKLIGFIKGSYVGATEPPYYKTLEKNEVFGIDFDEQMELVEIAVSHKLHINEVKNILALVLLMEHELVHTMLEYDEGSLGEWSPPDHDSVWEKILEIPERADEHHGAWFDYFVRKLFGHVGIVAAIENATDAAVPVAVSAVVLKDFTTKLRF